MPSDRPIDGVDASAFLLGQSPTTGRDHVIYYGSDAGVMSVKWRTMKVVFRYSESTSGPIIKPLELRRAKQASPKQGGSKLPHSKAGA